MEVENRYQMYNSLPVELIEKENGKLFEIWFKDDALCREARGVERYSLP